MGSLAATASTLLGIALAWFAGRGGVRSGVVLAIVATSLAVPGPILGLGIIQLLNQPDCPPLWFLYDQSILAPWLALMVRSLAPATLILWQALGSFPSELLDAAAIDGAGSLGRLCRVVLPNRVAALVLAWLVALAVALGDLAASILVVPAGVKTLSIEVFGLLHYGVQDQVAGICLALVATFAAIAAAATGLILHWRGDVFEV